MSNITTRYLILLLITICFTKLNSQSPGGVSAGLQTWLKANNGVTGANPITGWANQIATGTAVVVNGSPTLNAVSTSYNYNPYIDFSAPATPRQFLSLSGFNNFNGINYRALFLTAHLTDLTRSYTHIGTVQDVTFGSPPNGTLHGGIFLPSTAALDLGGDLDFGASGGVWRQNSAVTSYSNTHFGLKNTIAGFSTNNNPTTLNRFLGGQTNNPMFSFLGHVRDWRGPCAELIAYTSSVSVVESQRIESYLGVKYGITLPVNYLNTAGATIYAPTTTYLANIIGIGRDDAEALTQKQSHTNDDSVRIYLNTLAATNNANTDAFTNNISYVVIGADNGKLCAAASTSAEVPAGCALFSRIQREWKVTKTNFSQTYNMDIKLNACALTNSLNVANLRLIVDDDGNFAGGVTNCYFNGDGTGIVISYVNPIVTISNISGTHIPNNATRFITLASNNPLTPLPIELLYFTAECKNEDYVTLSWATAAEKNSKSYEIEKSIDAVNFKRIATVNAAGTSSTQKKYSYQDDEPFTGTAYYRLRATDNDGSTKVFNIVSAESDCFKKSGNFVIYPNPTTDELTLDGVNEGVSIQIINALGQIVYNNIFNQDESVAKFKINISDLPNAIYSISVTTANSKKVVKLIKHKE